jgi:hypothetical protein
MENLEGYFRIFDSPPHPGMTEPLIPVFVDNGSALRIARGDVLANASKHLKLRHLRVSEKQEQLFFCGTKLQQADAMTKSLGEAIFGMICVEEEADTDDSMADFKCNGVSTNVGQREE